MRPGIDNLTLFALIKLASCKHDREHVTTARLGGTPYCSRCGAVGMGGPLGWVRPVLLERIVSLLESASEANEEAKREESV